MRITILNQFYLPDISPTAQLAGSLAEHRAADGDEVTVVAGTAGYASVQGEVPIQISNGVRVCRIPTLGFGKKTRFLRALDYFAFFVVAAMRCVTLSGQDIVVAMTTPPYIVLAGLGHKLLHRRAKLVLWVMDCYPEVLEMAGMMRPGSFPARLLRGLNRLIFRRVDHVVTLDHAMTELLASQYQAAPGRPPFTVIPNWERLERFPSLDNYPRWEGIERHGLAGKFVVVYLGNAGAGHEFGTIVSVAEELKFEPIVFLFIGGGSRWKELAHFKREKELENVLLLDYIPKEQTGQVMAACQVALITLRESAAGLISPSKLHSNLALGLPVLYVGPPGSNVDEAIQRHSIGIGIRNGDVSGAIAFLRKLRNDPAALADMRDRARAAFEAEYCDRRTLPQYDAVLDGLTERRAESSPPRKSQ